MYIPDSVIDSVLKRKNIEKLSYIKKKDKNQAKIMRNAIQYFWDNMTAEERKEFLRKRGQRIKKGIAACGPEERKRRSDNLKAVMKKIKADPVKRAKLSEHGRMVCILGRAKKKRINTQVKYVDKPRINDYAGTITQSQLEELLNNGKNS